jgi:hypothetical protein
MISRLHQKLGTAGFIISIIALVAAMSGGAYAALSIDEKKEIKKQSKKFSKQFSKKFSKQFAKQGPQGVQGAPGAPGAKGAAGANGAQGAIGPIGPEGPEGPQGEEGNPWTAGGVLPTGETETGVWALGNDDGPSFVPLSFNIPLGEPPTAINFVNDEELERGESGYVTPTNCLGSVEEPTAPAGMVCVYADEEEVSAGFPGYLPFLNKHYESGAIFFYSMQSGDRAYGTWAVTAA